MRRKDSKNRVLKKGEYERKNGTYEYKFKDSNRKSKSIYAKNLPELRDKIKKLSILEASGINISGQTITVKCLYEKWLGQKIGLKENTIQHYKYLSETYILPRIGNYKVVELKNSDIRAMYRTMYEVNGLSINTIDSIHNIVHQVFEIALEDEYIRKNPASNSLRELKKLFPKDSNKFALTLEQQKLLVDYLYSKKTIRWRTVFITLLLTGLRVGEITALNWEDVDFENNIIKINKTLVYFDKDNTGSKFMINTPKTQAGIRQFPMLPKVREALMEEREFQNSLNLKCKVKIDGYSNFVFINRFGGVFHQGTLNKNLRRVIRDCNDEVLKNKGSIFLPLFSCHTLRHTFATRMFESGVNVKTMQSILGHTDISTTLNTYTHVLEDLKIDEINKVSEFLDM